MQPGAGAIGGRGASPIGEHRGLCPDVSVVHATGSGQLLANPHVAGQ